MSDGFSIDILTGPWDEFYRVQARLVDRASMYGMRAVGRRIGARSKTRAPVYHGDDPRAQAESGSLKGSIKNSREIKRFGGAYEMKVMPTGSKKRGTAVTRHGSGRGQVRGVPLYRRQMEEMYGYMAAGTSEGMSTAREIYESAYAKALAKYGPR